MFRKNTYLPFILALALTGCSDGFEPGQGFAPDGSISFGTYIGNAGSRASAVDASALQSSTDGFGVMAYLTGSDSYASAAKPNYMLNQQVVYGGGSWNYSPLKYWPAGADEKISFFAYAPYVDAAASPDASGSGITSLPTASAACDPVIRYEFGSDISSHIDLLYASATDKTNADGTVNFEFRHALSRIGFKVCGWEDDGSGIGFDDNTTVTVNAVTLSTLRRGASLNLYTGEWSENASGELQGFTLAGTHLQNSVIRPGDGAVQINTHDGYMMIAPDSFLEDGDAARLYCVLIDYTVETADPSLNAGKIVVRNKVYRHISPNFEPGKAYTINIHLGMGGNSGPGDDTTDAVGPAPVDPNPEDPTVPSTGGENGHVRFSASVTDWDGDDKVVIPLAPAAPAVFTASQEGLHIEGSFAYEISSRASDGDVLTLVSLAKEGSAENLLLAEQSFAPGAFTVPVSGIRMEGLESGSTYVLTLRNSLGHIYTAEVPVLFGMMQMTIDVPRDNADYLIPLSDCVSPATLVFLWGDGTQTEELGTLTSAIRRHTYANSGLKEVRILSSVHESSGSPQIPKFDVYIFSSPFREYLISMDTPILRTGQGSFAMAFQECTNLRSVHPGLFMHHTETEGFSCVFSSCKSLEAIPPDLFRHNTKAADFRAAFQNCQSLTEIPDGLLDLCTEARDLSNMFTRCDGVTRIPDGLLRHNVNAETVAGIFASTSITSVPEDLFRTNVRLTDVSDAFSGTKVSDFPEDLLINNPAVTNVGSLFLNCPISGVPEGIFRYNPGIQNVGSLFQNCKSLRAVPEGLFANCPDVTIAEYMFEGCTALEGVPEGLFTPCRGLTTAARMFYGCTALKSVPAGLFRDNTKITDIGSIFYRCTGLVDVPKTLFDSLDSVDNASFAFFRCSAITSEVPELWNRGVATHINCFYGVNNAANSADIPSDWK